MSRPPQGRQTTSLTVGRHLQSSRLAVEDLRQRQKSRKKISTPTPQTASATPRNTSQYLASPQPALAISTANPEIKNVTLTTIIEHKHNSSDATSQNVTRQESVEEMLITKLKDSLKTFVSSESPEVRRNESLLPLCEEFPDLGPTTINKTDMELNMVEKKYPEVDWGGQYKPPNCTARHKVAILVPFRDRQQHLAIFLNHMHPFLMKQQLEYGIFIIEQEGKTEFNRAKLFNVGFVESQKLKACGWQCFVFHDVDLIPMDLRNTYSCPRQPRHMSASIDKHDFRLPYQGIFGGVSAMTYGQFVRVNGFSNKYWGWGGEDDDMSYRLKEVGYHIGRYKMSIARYSMLDHKKASPNPKRYNILSKTSKNIPTDGLTTLHYKLLGVVRHHLYTQILANIDDSSWWTYFVKLLFG